jgi:hypothetical protein
MKNIVAFCLLLVSINGFAENDEAVIKSPEFMICTTLEGEGYNNNEVNCVNTTNMEQAQVELRRRGHQKRDLEKRYSKKLYPREHETSFLPQE